MTQLFIELHWQITPAAHGLRTYMASMVPAAHRNLKAARSWISTACESEGCVWDYHFELWCQGICQQREGLDAHIDVYRLFDNVMALSMQTSMAWRGLKGGYATKRD